MDASLLRIRGRMDAQGGSELGRTFVQFFVLRGKFMVEVREQEGEKRRRMNFFLARMSSKRRRKNKRAEREGGREDDRFCPLLSLAASFIS